MSSAKGHEYFLKHYLGTHDERRRRRPGQDSVNEVKWHEHAPQGKMDLVVDLNFRMDTSALYSDIILPAATWYEKADLNSTDMHSFIHPLSPAVPPCWESKSDWQIFQVGRQEVLRVVAEKHFPEPVEDLVRRAAGARLAAEIAQPDMKQWIKARSMPFPARRCRPSRSSSATTRISTTSSSRTGRWCQERPGRARHAYDVEDEYDEYVKTHPHGNLGRQDVPVAWTATRTFATIAALRHRDQRRVGVPFVQEHGREDRPPAGASGRKEPRLSHDFKDIAEPAAAVHQQPDVVGLDRERPRVRSAFTYNVETDVPWRTLTGRQHVLSRSSVYISTLASTCRRTSPSRCRRSTPT